MNMQSSSRHEEAALWFAKTRRGMMTLEEREAFATWRRVPENAAAIGELESVWSSLHIAQDRFGPAAAAAQPAPRVQIARSALLAVMCVLSLGLGVISFSGNRDFWTTLDWVDR